MGSVAGGGGEEEAENLRAVGMLHEVFDSFAKPPSYERGNQRESAEGSQKRVSKVQGGGCRIRIMGGLYGEG